METETKDLSPEAQIVAKQLVLEKLSMLPHDVKISIGMKGSLSPADLIELVEKDDPISKQLITAELNFLQALGGGTLLNELTDPFLDQSPA